MIENAAGNLLHADVQALVNAVNCVGIMGKGLALQFKQAYPEMAKAYATACGRGEVKPGVMHVWETGTVDGPRFVINFPTKRHWREQSRCEDIEAGLAALTSEVAQRQIASLAVPALGCGNGGLAWSQIRPMIESAFAALPEVRVLLYPPAEVVAASDKVSQG